MAFEWITYVTEDLLDTYEILEVENPVIFSTFMCLFCMFKM